MSFMDESDQDLLSESPLPVIPRPSSPKATARGTSSLGRDEKRRRRRRLTRPSPAASPMDLDDTLSEILLRLPPLPSSLPRASLVCTRWRRLVTDPSFVRRFRARHWRPLGVFFGRDEGLSFRYLSDPRYPTTPPAAGSLSVRVLRKFCRGYEYHWEFHSCRHGRVVLAQLWGVCSLGFRRFLVWNPVTGEAHSIDITHFFDPVRNHNGLSMKGTVICASGDKGPFQFALMWDGINQHSSHICAHICVYSSETGAWGDVFSAAIKPLSIIGYIPGFGVCKGDVLVGNTLYWVMFGIGHQPRILQFDLSTQNLAVIEGPPLEQYCDTDDIFLCTLANGGGLSLIAMSRNLEAQLWLWERSLDSDGVTRWVHGGTIQLDKLLSLRSVSWCEEVLSREGDDNLMVFSTNRGDFMVDLESMQFEKLSGISSWDCIYPFKNQYAQGTGFANCSSGSISIL